MMIRDLMLGDKADVVTLAKVIGFDSDEISVVEETLADYFGGNSNAIWLVAEHGDRGVVGVLYCTPEVMTQGTWNALMLLVNPDFQRQGYGRALMERVEKVLVEKGAHLLLVETSSLDDFAQARAFYSKYGFIEEARIGNFYSSGNDKIIFSKTLNSGIE